MMWGKFTDFLRFFKHSGRGFVNIYDFGEACFDRGQPHIFTRAHPTRVRFYIRTKFKNIIEPKLENWPEY